MVGRKEQRQAAIQAAIAKKKSSAPASATSDSKSVITSKSSGSSISLFRRSRSQTRSTPDDDRNDGHEKDATKVRSSSREKMTQPRNSRRSKSTGRISGSDTISTADNSSIFGRGDKRQKMVVYTSFSENPFDVLTIQVDEKPPHPRNRSDVVLKILVSWKGRGKAGCVRFAHVLTGYLQKASTVSYNDCMIRRGICFDVINPTGLPATPGMDVVGNIVAIGESVKGFKVGDRVAALIRTGGNARYACVPESDLVEVPRTCDSAEAVCMVSTFMTAYQCLRLVTNDNFALNGKRILITGGIEPVGQALIQLCFRSGASEIYATAPDHRHGYLRTVLGACPLPVDPKLWLGSIKGSMDIVFDGTCYDSLDSASASLNKNGILVSLGMSALLKRENPGVLGAPLAAYWAKLKSQIMSNSHSYEVWNSFTANKDAYKLDLEILFHLLKKRFIKPHIAKRVALSEVAEAQNSLEKETTRGEIVCLPWKRLGK